MLEHVAGPLRNNATEEMTSLALGHCSLRNPGGACP